MTFSALFQKDYLKNILPDWTDGQKRGIDGEKNRAEMDEIGCSGRRNSCKQVATANAGGP